MLSSRFMHLNGHSRLVGGGGFLRVGMRCLLGQVVNLASESGRAAYGLRKEVVEPVFGQIKEVLASGRVAHPPPETHSVSRATAPQISYLAMVRAALYDIDTQPPTPGAPLPAHAPNNADASRMRENLASESGRAAHLSVWVAHPLPAVAAFFAASAGKGWERGKGDSVCTELR
jgi:hypothetical protein